MARWTLALAVAIAPGALLLGACNKGDEATPAPSGASSDAAADGPLAQALDNTADLSETAKLVKAAGLDKTFGGVGSYTMFAPTNAAIAAVPEAERTALASEGGRAQLIALLGSHVSPGYMSRADLDAALERSGGTIEVASVGAAPIRVHKQGSEIRLGDGEDAPKVVGNPIVATNGVIFPIDRVLATP